MIYSLWHQIGANIKKEKCDTTSTTSMLSALAMFIIGICTLSIGLWLTFIAHMVICTEWVTIFTQRFKYKKSKLKRVNK